MHSLYPIKKHLKTHFHTFILGCAIGILCFISIYGINVIDVTNVTWLLDSSKTEKLWDLTQHYLGWVFYRNSEWSFPLGLVSGLYVEPVSIVYTDSIPLFALFFKILSPILPENFQYLGLFGLICYSLMGGFGALITRRFTDSLFINCSSSFIFSISPCLLKRMFYHTALSAHFVILAAFCLWLYRDTTFKKRSKYILLWSILSVVATLINPYLTPMVLGILFCSLLQELIASKSLCGIIPGIIFPCVSIVISGYAIGIFYGNVSAASYGLDLLSFNLLQFFNPANYLLTIDNMQYLWEEQNLSWFLPALPSVSPWQEEGFSYLGLGMILLLLVTVITILVKIFTHKIQLTISKENILTIVIPLFVCAGVFTFLALSPKATIGNTVLYHIDYPEIIYNALSIFRSTGRLIWPVYYGFMALILIACIYIFKNHQHFLYILLCATICIQTADLIPGILYKHHAYTQDFSSDISNFKSQAWIELGKNSTEIIFYPPTEDLLYFDPEFSCRCEEYAAEYDLSLSVTYMSRNFSGPADAYAIEHFEQRAQGKRFSDIIYIFSENIELPDPTSVGLNYYLIDGYIIGTERNLDYYSDVSKYIQ